MRVLVTGATGKVGHAVASALLERGDHVRALVRDPKQAASVLPAGIEPVKGDATDPETLAAAVEGCEQVFNAMGLPEQWVRDRAIFDRVNAVGSGELAAAAKRAGVRRFIHTSTEDVFHAERGDRFDETMLAGYPKATPYERSKQRAEELVMAERDGMEVVVVNPTGVYGPGPSASTSFDKDLFAPLVKKRIPALPPGGISVAFVEGVAQGHLLAAEKGREGNRYILADTHVTPRELAESVVRIAGRRCWPADSCIGCSGTPGPIRARRSASLAGGPHRSRWASTRRSPRWACSRPSSWHGAAWRRNLRGGGKREMGDFE
jgi:nucleoside-diphosphate-sugar epimerase